MARLIPRKQIEEQKDITGSLSISENLFLGSDAVVSGSIFVSKSFFFGNDTGSKNEITGSVFLTGSLIIDGELNLANLTQLSATASNALESVDTQRYSGILAKDFGANQPTLYVSSTDGDDTNDGRTIQYPLRTIKRAAQLSSPGYDGRYGFDTASISNGYVIKVQAGTYLEDNPVILPKNTTIWGAGLRITKINAKNPTEDLFWVNAGCYVAEVTMGGLRLFPDQINPEKGFAIAFQPGAFITTSPYIQNCSQISNQENSFTELYEDIPPGGGGLYVNGDVIHPDSPLSSMVLDAYTQISPNGVGCLVNGRGFIQLVSFFTNFSYYAIRVNNGGHATLNNSNISFGLFGMYASGSRFISGSGGNIAARDSVRGTWSCVVDVLNKGLEAGLPSTTKLNTDEGIRLSQPSVFPQYTTSSNVVLSTTAAEEIFSDFKLISEIVDKGTSDFPTLLARSSNKGYGFDSPYNILGAQQITSSISSASLADLTNVSESYRVLLSIFANGTGSYKLTSSADLGVKITDTAILALNAPSYLSSSVSSSFATILNILKGNKRTISSGTPYLEVENTLLLSTLPPITSSNSASIYVGDIEPFSTGLSSSLSVQNKVSASFSIITNILERGTGSVILPIPQNHQREYTIINNNSSSYQWSGVGSTTNTNTTTPNIFTVTNNGSGNYVINGQSNPTLSLIEGQTYTFNINASGHPFWIKTNISLGTGDAYNTGVTNNGTANGTITFVVPIGAPTLYYNCQYHSSMAGTINTLSSNVTTTTTTSAPNNNVTASNNPTITLYRGETYKLYVSASSIFGGINFPFFIRTKPLSGISEQYDYDKGVVNNGDSVGTITFSVPYDAPNELYYVSQNYSAMAGKFHIINNSATPFDLISNTLTYPKIISGSNVSTENVDILNAYEILTGSKSFIQEEVIEFVSSSWSTFDYTESIFRSNVGFVINAVCEDLLYGGNINSINAGKFYDEYVSNKTIVENDATVTAIKYASGLGNDLVNNKTFTDITAQIYNSERLTIADNLFANREFIQNETIAFLSSSWSNFYYNEEKCKRDTGYILDAVITDLKYGGNERSVIAGKFYYDYPSLAIVEGDGDGEGQLGQTLDGIRYAAGLATNIVKNKTLNSPSASTQIAYDLLRDNKSLIQNETIQFINVAFPQLKYNQTTCKRDVGYIIDAISTDLLYGGNERAVTAGRYYYDYPSLATSVQRRETTAGIRYAKIIGDFVIQNIILDTPRIISNDEKNIRVSNVNNTISSFSGTAVEQLLVSSSFGIIQTIVLRGLGAIQSALALDTGLGWSKTNPLNISSGSQITNIGTGSYVSSSLSGFNIVTNIIKSGSSVAPTIVSNTLAGIKATTVLQYTASNSASNSDKSIVSASFGNIINIVTNGTGSIPNTTLNTNRGVRVTNISQITSSITPSGFESGKVTNGFNLVLDIIENGTGSLPTIIQNASNLVKRTNSTQFVSTASISQTYITASKNSFNLISDIVEYGTGSLPALVRNVEDLVRITDTIRYSSSYAISSSNVDSITSKFDTIISILESGVKSFTPTTATYNPANGEFVITIPNHTLKKYNSIYIRPESFVFTCDMDGNRTEHALPGVGQYPYSNKLQIQSVTTNTITVNVGASGPNVEFNPTNATYDPATGEFVVTVGEHDLSIGEGIVFATRSFAFTCDMDDNQSTKSYPRFGIDPFSVRSIPITAVSEDTLTFNVGISGPNKFFTPTSASYNALTGDMILTVGQHGIGVGRGIVLASASIAFTCDQDNNQTTHSYPRSGSDPYAGKSIEISSVGFTQHTVTNAPHNAATGLVTLTIAGHGFSNGDYVKISDNSLTYTCELDENVVSKSYPRPGYDYPSGRWLEIAGVTTNTFEINVGPSSYTGQHTFVTASINGVQRQDGTFTINVGDGGSASGSIHTFVSASQDAVQHLPQSVHTFVSASAGALRHYPQSEHTFVRTTQNSISTLPIIIENIDNTIKVTSANQYISASSATNAESIILSASIAIVTNILVNGTGSAIVSSSLSFPTSSYVTVTSSSNKILAYQILKNNLDFIVSESIAYLSSSWSTASYDESKCRRDLKGILSGSAEDLIFNSNSASVFNGIFYYQFPSQAQAAQLNQTLDVINYASKLAQKVILNTQFVLPTSQSLVSRDILVNNKLFIQNETIAYLSSSWSSHSYNEVTCKRDIGHIIDAVATDTIYGGNERTVNAGVFYYLYPSAATGSQIDETVTGINYSKNLSDKLLRGNQFIKVAQNKLQAKELIIRNKGFIQNEVIAYVSASWSGFIYNEQTCKRDIGYILDAVVTDVVYGGNERSLEAGEYYYRYPSQATTTQLGPTLAGIEHSKGLVNEILKNKVFILPTTSAQTAFNLINSNKGFIQSESIAYVSSSWSFFEYNDIKCARDIGYILDAVATDTLYGGNERTAKAGEYYYLYPSLAIVEGDGDGTGQLGQTLDGINYAKGITQKIVSNFLLQSPTQSELDGYDLLFKNKKLIQSESIAYLDSAWSTFEYNKTTCRRDLSYIIDAVATDLKYGGNQRTNKAGEYYYLYPSLAVVANTTTGQLEQTVDGIRFAAGISNKIVNNTQLIQQPQASISASVSLIRQNRGFIQNETVEYIDAFYPYLIYNREKCRRDTGYILDAVITDLFYGGNERSVIAGKYYYDYPSLAITNAQKKETVNGIEYAKSVTELVAQNIKLVAPILQLNTDDNIKVTNTTQYSSSLSGSITEVSKVNSSFEIVTDIIEAGVKSFTPTNATYNPANGDFVITIPNHRLNVYNFIYLRQKSFVFTCTMDGNRTEHALPGVGQYPYSNKLEIKSVTQNTITVNVGKSGPNVEFTPTSASYNPATGEFVVTVGPHNLSIGEGIVLSTGSFAFTCDMDNNHSTKSYPRFGIDPYSVRSIPITAVTNNTLTFNVGISAPNKFFTPTSASYNALTGDMILTVGQHGLGVGRSVTLASASIAFTCDQDNNQTTHSYPRSGSDPYAGKSIEIISVGASTHTVQNAPYDALTGITTLTINNHGFSNGDYIKISNNSLTYTCVLDENEVLKSYPRPGYDYPSGRWLEISNVTTNTFTIDIGPSSYVDSHTFITASLNGLERQTGTFTINVGDGGSASGSIHTFVSASANAVRHLPQSVHTFVSASAGAIKHYPQAAHTFVRTTRNSVSTLPIIVSNVESLIKVTNAEQFTSSISASGVEVDIVTSSFKLIRDIIYNGSSSVPDSLAANFNYGFQLKPPTTLHISSINQILGSGSYNSQTSSVSSSFGTIINIVKKGVSVSPSLSTNTSASLKRTDVSQYSGSVSASAYQLNRITNGYDIILNIVENGYSVVPTLITNVSSSIKVTESPQLISGSAADRLQGKLISASFGLVIDILLNGTGSAPSMISGSGANSNPKINAAYNLLLGNKSFIVSESIAYLSSSWSTFEYNQQSCSRDLSGIIDGAAIDLLYGGNSASLFNGKFYYQFPSQASGTGSQVQQTVTVLRYASQIAEKVVRNIPLTHISASVETSASYVSLTKNKAFIQSESIAYLSSSWSEFEYSQSTCMRDIGYVIDAVATDLLYGGNERAIIAGNYYYDYPSLAITTQLEPTLTGIRFGKGTALNVVVNKQYFTASANISSSYTLLVDNRNYIQSESVAFVNAKYPNLEYSESKCLRDVGFIVDAVATDLLYGGNERSRKAGLFYNQYPSEANGTGSQIIETTAAIEYASRLSTQIINSVLIPTPQTILNGTASIDTNVLAAYDLLINNKAFIQSESLQYLTSSWSTAMYNPQSRSLDLGYIVDAVANDLLFGGNESSVNIAVAYLLTASLDTIEKMESNVTTIDYAKGLASKLVQSKVFVTASQNISASVNLLRLNREFIQDETLAYLTASWSTFEYDKVKCKRDTGYILDSVTTDLLYGGNERSVEAGDLYYRYPSLAVLEGDGDGTGQLGQTVDGLNYASRLAQKKIISTTFVTASLEVSASFDLLRKNKSFIQNEVIAYVSSSWSGVYYNEVTCKRDVGYLIDAAATDVLYGGQERSVIAGSYYYLYPSRATNKGVPSEQNQLDPTLTGIRWAGRLAKKVIINPTFQLPSASLVTTVDLLKFNKTLIQKETITFISSSWTSLNYNEASCSRDLGFILDAIRTDLVYGGNERSIEAGSYYYKYPSVAIYESYNSFGDFGQKKQTVEGINFARGISEKLVTNKLLTYLAPSTKRRQAGERLRAGKDELKQRAIGYTNGAFPYLVYNEASCSRDTGLIVDACVTDLFYGGNERGIAAAASYYNGQFGNGDEVIFKQRLETLEANRYLRTRAEFITAGAPLESFGSLIVATGIDYSYNGSGVTFKALPPNQGGSGVPNPAFEITELGGGRIFFTSGNQDGDFRIGTGLSINQATGTLVGRTFSKSLFSLVTPFSLALQI